MAVQNAAITICRSVGTGWCSRKLTSLLRSLFGLRKGVYDVDVYGSAFRLYPGENRADKILLTSPHAFDVGEREFVRAQLAKLGKAVFIDLGANSGAYSAYIHQQQAAEKVIAIEANPDMAARLAHNLPDTATILPHAVSDKAGSLDFYINHQNKGESSLMTGEGEKITVKAFTLAEVLEKHVAPAPYVMKVDVEGAEHSIFEAFFKNSAKEIYPKAILMEKIHAPETVQLLLDHGYRIEMETKLNAGFVYEK